MSDWLKALGGLLVVSLIVSIFITIWMPTLTMVKIDGTLLFAVVLLGIYESK